MGLQIQFIINNTV